VDPTTRGHRPVAPRTTAARVLAGGDGGVTAVVLAGGGARRFGGRDKLALTVGGVPLLGRVLAVVDALGWPAVVVGPHRDLPPGLPEPVRICEDPPGGGPAHALGTALASPGAVVTDLVAVLAGDLPHLDVDALQRLADAARTAVAGGRDGALAVDDAGRDQLLLGVWAAAALRRALAGIGPGTSVRSVFAGLQADRVHLPGDPPPWADCDTDADLTAARTAAAARPAPDRRSDGCGVRAAGTDGR